MSCGGAGTNYFHHKCLRKWLIEKKACPLCRETDIITSHMPREGVSMIQPIIKEKFKIENPIKRRANIKRSYSAIDLYLEDLEIAQT